MVHLILQGEFNYSEEILNGEMARIIYRDAAQKIKGDLTFPVLNRKIVALHSAVVKGDRLSSSVPTKIHFQIYHFYSRT